MGEVLAVSDVARLLGVASDTVRYYERTGQLPAQKTPGGVRVFQREAVEQFREQRKGYSLTESPGRSDG
jgi:excisionase family DNA binding protein